MHSVARRQFNNSSYEPKPERQYNIMFKREWVC